MDNQLRALCDPVRREILLSLSAGEAKAGDIAAAFSLTRPAISHHLKILSDAGLISMRRRAQARIYSINTEAVARLRVDFNQFWDNALPKLKAVVESDLKAKRRRRKRSG
ncbi:MAG: metalloregulator ArsR/SmtB family transcription factor [Gammaproteobacteria bacterium]|nr:metalloregulator ArsR/SmtB family transcription factor [Gammaproteobacteria bacterium]